MVYLRGGRVWCNGNPRRPPDLKATDRFGTRAPICKGIFCRRKLLLVLPPIIEHVLIFFTQSYKDAALHDSAKIQSQIGKNTTQTSSTMIITPRFHLLELGDQSWCPEWLREYSHLARIQMWKTEAPGGKGSPAAQVCDLLVDKLPDASSFTFIDSCAGGGGPIPIMEATLNQKLHSKGQGPVQFILTDLFPAVSAWKAIAKQSDNISYIEEPVDATKALRLAEPGKKECRIFNLYFHHFDDPAAKTVLRSAVESADAFVYVLPNQSSVSFRCYLLTSNSGTTASSK